MRTAGGRRHWAFWFYTECISLKQSLQGQKIIFPTRRQTYRKKWLWPNWRQTYQARSMFDKWRRIHYDHGQVVNKDLTVAPLRQRSPTEKREKTIPRTVAASARIQTTYFQSQCFWRWCWSPARTPISANVTNMVGVFELSFRMMKQTRTDLRNTEKNVSTCGQDKNLLHMRYGVNQLTHSLLLTIHDVQMQIALGTAHWSSQFMTLNSRHAPREPLRLCTLSMWFGVSSLCNTTHLEPAN